MNKSIALENAQEFIETEIKQNWFYDRNRIRR